MEKSMSFACRAGTWPTKMDTKNCEMATLSEPEMSIFEHFMRKSFKMDFHHFYGNFHVILCNLFVKSGFVVLFDIVGFFCWYVTFSYFVYVYKMVGPSFTQVLWMSRLDQITDLTSCWQTLEAKEFWMALNGWKRWKNNKSINFPLIFEFSQSCWISILISLAVKNWEFINTIWILYHQVKSFKPQST